MTNTATRTQLREILSPWGQAHLLKFWDDLDDAGRARLANQIRDIDWAQLHDWVQALVEDDSGEMVPADLEPASYYPLAPDTAELTDLYRRARTAGEELLRGGAVAGFTVAGGQGTRLGYDAPKGTFPIGPVSGNSLFQLFAETIARAGEKYGTRIPWYIMTSPINDAATRAFLEQNDFFGLDPADVTCFQQGTLPAVDRDGRVLLAEPGRLALSPNGHGGSLPALRDSGALADMADRGIEYISYWQVDNPLVYAFDLLFIGLHHLLGSQMSCRSLTKTGPEEKLGCFCTGGGNTCIVEYSDMPEEMLAAREADGALRYRAGSPAIHIVSRAFVERLTETGCSLPIHRAHKKVPFVDDTGARVDPDKPNAVKFEMFVFDALPLADTVLILEADRREQFAPVKNLRGIDSVESCRRLMLARSLRWLRQAGVPVPPDAGDEPGAHVELSPRRFLDPDDVKQAASDIAPVTAGDRRYLS